jgi:hypothetical protein
LGVFKLPGDKLTAMSAFKNYIPTPSIPANRSMTLRNHRIPEHNQVEVETQIQKMPKTMEFSNLVCTKKKDALVIRKWRICLDFRKFNYVKFGDNFPLLNIQDILDRLGRARFFLQ